MTRSLSPRSSLPTLKRDAKRWLAALRAGDDAARTRLQAAWPAAPDDPTLRDVQHALACEYGFRDWKTLGAALHALAATETAAASSTAEQLSLVLRHGWDGQPEIARRLVARNPSLRTANVFLAAASGDVDTVRDLLARDASLVRATDEVRGWTPLAHVAYGRLDERHALAIATLLLDAGADVAFRFDDGWGNPFTLITGAIGLGEGVKPSHPQAPALVDLFLARGAEAYDTQALYNTSIVDDDLTWTVRLWAACERRGTTARWSAHDDRAIGGRFKSNTLDYLLGNAVGFGHPRRAAWLLERGANARAVHAYSGRPLHTEAVLSGRTEIAALLAAHGAVAETLRGVDELVAAVMRGDLETLRAIAAREPALLTGPLSMAAPRTLIAAARADRVAMIEALIDLGVHPNVVDHEGATALHRAVHADARGAIRALIAAGIDVDRRDTKYRATALGWSNVLGRPEAGELLAPHSRDVPSLVRAGAFERTEAVLRDDPSLARATHPDANAPTALFHLPDDDEEAAAFVELLLRHGADPRRRGGGERTAAELAALRGLETAAAILTAATSR